MSTSHGTPILTMWLPRLIEYLVYLKEPVEVSMIRGP